MQLHIISFRHHTGQLKGSFGLYLSPTYTNGTLIIVVLIGLSHPLGFSHWSSPKRNNSRSSVAPSHVDINGLVIRVVVMIISPWFKPTRKITVSYF